MKSITIRELHERTGKWLREAGRRGQILVTFNGKTVAKILPEKDKAATPYFSRRKLSPSFKRRFESGQFGAGGTDSTAAISEDREDRV